MKIISMYFVIALLALAVGVGCEKSPDVPEAPAVEASDEQEAAPQIAAEEPQSPLVKKAHELAQLRKDIKADPENVDQLLAEAELTEESLDALLFEIAEDPDASAAYAAH